MPDPLSTTFEFLANTDNIHAVDALLPALDSQDDRIRNAATLSLLKRRSSRGHIELVRRLDRLTPAMQSVVVRNSGGIENSLRQCLLHGDERLQFNALNLISAAKDYSQMPGLLNLLEDKHSPLHDRVIAVMLELVDFLYDHLNPVPESGTAHGPLRDAARIRDQLIASLDQSCNRFEAHGCDVVIECLLALADVENFAIKKLLRQLGHPCREIAERLLLTSTHPGVMSRVTDFMGVNYPPQKAIQAVKTRTDPEFITHLLRSLPRRLSPAQQLNYKNIDAIAWLQQRPLELEVIPLGLQKRLLTFVLGTGLPELDQRRVVDWVIKFGNLEARQVATEILENSAHDAVQDIVIDGLYSEDPEVQAWATSQLRARGIPEAFSLLIERLDSPVSEVQDAARVELGDFNLKRVLELYDQLDPRTCVLAGTLIQKIDPQSLKKLRTEMTNPMRSKRIRAVQAVQAMQLQAHVEETLLKLLEDEDSVVRRTAVEVLATIPSPAVRQALAAMLEDSSPRVRHEAERSLQKIHGQANPAGSPEKRLM